VPAYSLRKTEKFYIVNLKYFIVMSFKTKHTLMIGRKPKDQLDLFKAIFWKSTWMAEKALEIYKTIANAENNGWNPRNWKQLCDKLQLKPSTYYQIIRVMQACGMIKREYNRWKVSGRFLSFIEPFIEIYEELSKYKSTLRRYKCSGKRGRLFLCIPQRGNSGSSLARCPASPRREFGKALWCAIRTPPNVVCIWVDLLVCLFQ